MWSPFLKISQYHTMWSHSHCNCPGIHSPVFRTWSYIGGLLVVLCSLLTLCSSAIPPTPPSVCQLPSSSLHPSGQWKPPSSRIFYSKFRDLCQPDYSTPVTRLQPPIVYVDMESSPLTQPLFFTHGSLNLLNPPKFKLAHQIWFKCCILPLSQPSPLEIVHRLKLRITRHTMTKSQYCQYIFRSSCTRHYLKGGGSRSAPNTRNDLDTVWGISLRPDLICDYGTNRSVVQNIPRENPVFMVDYVAYPSLDYSVWKQELDNDSQRYLELDCPLHRLLDYTLSREQLLKLAESHLHRNVRYMRASKNDVILQYLKKHDCTRAGCVSHRVICECISIPVRSPRQDLEEAILLSGQVNISVPFEYIQRFSLSKANANDVTASHDCFQLQSYRPLPSGFDSAAWSVEWTKLGYIALEIPIPQILELDLKHKSLVHIATMHGIPKCRSMKKDILLNLLQYHECSNCPVMLSVCQGKSKDTENATCDFPPKHDWKAVWEKRMSLFCNDISLDNLEEVGCISCGQLTLLKTAIPVNSTKSLLNFLTPSKHGLKGVSRVERPLGSSRNDPITEIKGPILASGCTHFCAQCHASLTLGELPSMALANGNWIGDVPDVLKDLTYAEKLLVGRSRPNYCVVRIKQGGHKMYANAISFSNPTAKVYCTLPPPKSDIEQILAILYIGKNRPTPHDMKRTPMLVRHRKVHDALQWLILNHQDYEDVNLSIENLNGYVEEEVPVAVEWLRTGQDGNVDVDSAANWEDDSERGTETGMCQFSVQGLLENDLLNFKNAQQYKAAALKHLNSGGRVLAVGHGEHADTLYNNPNLYPRSFPWLFPYGMGGVGNVLCIQPTGRPDKRPKSSMPDKLRRRCLLNYHDKRFQTDEHFALVAFNHQQIRDSSTGANLYAKKNSFPVVADRLQRIDPNVLQGLSDRMKKGHVKPTTDEEKLCYDVLSDLDHVAYRVEGSLTSKKYMRNELWSLISHFGAPMWFITFAPDDSRHPVSLYFADTKETFKPEFLSSDERQRMIAKNPVASAKFFHKMVELFIKHILGLDHGNLGVFGETEAYYGAVEQQGRLTLHLHLLLWIRGALTPKEIRGQLTDPGSAFQKELIQYLETMQMGQMTRSEPDIRENFKETFNDYRHDPRAHLPVTPTAACSSKCGTCRKCLANNKWWGTFRDVTDQLMIKCNRHDCAKNVKCSPEKCKGRFPREIVLNSSVDPNDGHLTIKHCEPWCNSINPCLTYLMACNTDVTCMLSGSSLKAIVAYVSDYVTKPALKTYGIFDAMKSVITRNSSHVDGTINSQENGRRVITQIVNALTSRMEIGNVFAAAYMMGLPDHFASHQFVTFFWKQYVKAIDSDVVNAQNPSKDEQMENETPGKVVNTGNDGYALFYVVQDYIFRPEEYTNINLYDWIVYSVKSKLSAPQKNKIKSYDSGEDVQNKSFVNSFVFRPNHPQRLTHKIYFSRSNSPKLPNFSTSLPRSDKGDREFYCKTMLTFFKPWRIGYDLKTSDINWASAFQNHTFSNAQHRLMKNFNVRYECYDARDEFSAQQRNKTNCAPAWLTNEVLEDIEHMNYMKDYAEDDLLRKNDEDVIKGKKTIAKEIEMSVMSEILRNSGWTDKTPDGLSSLPKATANIEDKLTSHWTNLLKLEKDQRLKQKANLTPDIDADRDNSGLNLTPMDVDVVKLVDRSYLEAKFRPRNRSDKKMIDRIAKRFGLNEEQERAFRIISNHACTPGMAQLKMYLGGMGGTGKSRVIQAVVEMFSARKESHRFIVVAPTGSAAALLNGSTYHSVLGLGKGDGENNDNLTALSKMVSRLQGVEYIFLDEVSMLSCSKMYGIAEKLAQRNADPTNPFGSMNMIFSGDFAQLPPVMEGASYALYSGTVGNDKLGDKRTGNKGPYWLQSAMGKTLWHQITTVVILRQNMRQTKQSVQDSKYRTALVNMRYGACTPEDIKFLKTLVANKSSKGRSLSQKKFRNVPVIVTRNIQRDKINDLGCHKFAADHGLRLHEFYSEDEWLPPHEILQDAMGNTLKRRRIRHPPPGALTIDSRLQNHIWTLPHSLTDHKPGCLKLCKGMPVMIKYNVATECCVTNGAEATVVDWKSHTNSSNKQVLDVIFVKLVNPPSTISLPGLPVDVVPLAPHSTTVQCMLKDDKLLSIKRKQVPILPNFAMTDYCSQGRTRTYNVVNLETCANTLSSVYTALSRSSSADNTIIIQDFDIPALREGVSGYLRQEYRELEILDHISKLRYNGKLPSDLEGMYRNDLIQQYRARFGKSFMPEHTHPSIKWSFDTKWDEHPEPTEFQPVSRKRKRDQEGEDDSHEIKRRKTARGSHNSEEMQTSVVIDDHKLNARFKQPEKPLRDGSTLSSSNAIASQDRPIGFQWDSVNWSCAYDSFLYILTNLWTECSSSQRQQLRNLNLIMKVLSNDLDTAAREQTAQSYENVRTTCRNVLWNKSKEWFPYGRNMASVLKIACTVLRSDPEAPITQFKFTCESCKEQDEHSINPIPIYDAEQYWDNHTTCSASIYTLLQRIFRGPLHHTCPTCGSDTTLTVVNSRKLPPILMFDLSCIEKSRLPLLNRKLILKTLISKKTKYHLKGVIYYKDDHFTSTFVASDKRLWWSDGMLNSGIPMPTEPSNLLVEHGKFAALALYAKTV